MNVQKVNDEGAGSQDSYKSLLLLDEISKGEPLSQRDLSRKLNIALGLVNSYVKNLVSKGYVTVRAIPAKRYTYYLTPKGFSEKTRLTYHHLQHFTNLYREARETFKRLFKEMAADGMKRVVFAGTDEVAEIAYLTLQESGLKLAGVVDTGAAGRKFFGMKVMPISALGEMKYDCVIVTTYLKRVEISRELMQHLGDRKTIREIFPL
jgi:DNA-binding MarR family transcriptional regulator